MEFRGVHVLMRTSRRARSRSVEAFDPPLRDAQRVQKTMGVRNDDDEIDDGGLFLARSRARARVGIAASVTNDPDGASSIDRKPLRARGLCSMDTDRSNVGACRWMRRRRAWMTEIAVWECL